MSTTRPVTFQSRFPNHTFGNSERATERLQFSGGFATTNNAELIDAARKDPEFGEHGSFWEVKLPDAATAGKRTEK